MMARRLAVLTSMEATCIAAGAASAAAIIALAFGAGPGVTVLVFLQGIALVAAVLAFLRAEAAQKGADKASADLAIVAQQLIRLERQRQAGGGAPALRSTVAEVTGTVGLLGGVVRELARNVAAQNRDVAYLKDTLGGAAGGDRHDVVQKAAPSAIPAEEPFVPQPEPSLLPGKETEGEIRRMRLVTQAFEADGIELHLQPVVTLPQRKVRFYEALARLRLVDGTLLGPTEFLPILERLGRAPEFDRRVLSRALLVAQHLAARGSEAIVAVNLSLRSVMEPGFLWSVIRLMDASPEILGRVVLELPQRAWRCLDVVQKEALAALRERGVPLSYDRVADLSFDARALADLGVRFVKFPADLMLAAAEQENGRPLGEEISVYDFAAILRREGIKLVAEKVEREEAVPAVIDLGAPLAQGFVFAAPRAVRPEVLSTQDGASLRRAG